MGKTIISILVAFTILVVPIGAQNVFAGPPSNNFPPGYAGDPNSLHFEWDFTTSGGDADVFNEFPDGFALNECLTNPLFGAGFDPTNGGILEIDNDRFRVATVNYVDDLTVKDYRIQVDHSGDFVDDSSSLRAEVFDQDDSPGFCASEFLTQCKLLVHVKTVRGYYEDWRCIPNPDIEYYKAEITGQSGSMAVVVDTITFNAVGGTVLSPDTVSLLVLEAQSSAVWWLPAVVLGGVGAALFTIRKNKN